MNKIINNLKSKSATELINLDYGDFFEFNSTVYQFLYHYDVYRVVKNIETGETEYMDKTTKVYKLKTTTIIDGYSYEED